MKPFVSLLGIAAPLPLTNVDTDKMLPGRFLKTISRRGLGAALFYALRYDERGQKRSEFVLNRSPWREAQILIALDNFGCGSSREHAPWALLDFGIRCVIAPSFADIFYNNCFKNGILPVMLPLAQVETLLSLAGDAAQARLQVNLPTQSVTAANGATYRFELAAERKNALLHGWDEIGESLAYGHDVDAFEARWRAAHPWFPGITTIPP